MKETGLFAAGVLFGTAGLKMLGSKDAKKVYAHTHTTAAVLRAKDCVMTAVIAVREGADNAIATGAAIAKEISLCGSLLTIRAFHDVTDEFYQTEFAETLPRLETLDSQSLALAISQSPYASAVDEAYAPRLLELL